VHLVRSNIHTAIALPASFSDRTRLPVLNQRPLLLGKGGAASTNAASTNSTAGCFDPPCKEVLSPQTRQRPQLVALTPACKKKRCSQTRQTRQTRQTHNTASPAGCSHPHMQKQRDLPHKVDKHGEPKIPCPLLVALTPKRRRTLISTRQAQRTRQTQPQMRHVA